VREVAEIFIAEGVVAHILHERSAIGVGVGFFQFLIGEAGEARFQHGLNAAIPEQIDDLLVGENGIGPAAWNEEGSDAQEQDRAQQSFSQYAKWLQSKFENIFLLHFPLHFSLHSPADRRNKLSQRISPR
jgi:hypothetical protein